MRNIIEMVDIINIDDSARWDSIIKGLPAYDVYYLSGYVKAFQRHGDGNPVLLYYESEKGRAFCVLMLRDVAEDSHFKNILPTKKYFDAVTPYGYGGFIFDGEVNREKLAMEFRQILNEKNINSVFSRFHPVLDNAKENEGIVNVIPLGKTIAIDLTSPEVIWNNITSKNRNMIRKAEKSGVEIHHGKGIELLRKFKVIYDETMRGDNADEYYYFKDDFYQSIADDLKDNYEIFYATLGDKIISIAIFLFANGKMHYHLSGSVREFRSLAPSNLLLYKAALWGYEKGFKTLHLGGGVGSGEDPLYKFKAAFNRNSDYRFSIGKMIVDEDQYNYLKNLRATFDPDFNSESNYFPVYRS